MASAGQVTILLLVSIISCCCGIQWLALSRVSSLAVASQRRGSGGRGVCDSFSNSFVRQQVRFCKDHLAFMEAVKVGAIWAIDECQYQFRTRRWNCSTLNDAAIELYRKQMGSDVPVGASDPPVKAERLTRQTTPVANSTPPIKTGSPKRRKKRGRKKLHRSLKKMWGIVGPFPIVPQGTREAAFVHAISSAGVAHAITRSCSSGQLEDCGCDWSVKRTPAGQDFQWSGCSDNIAYGVSLSKRFVDARDRKAVQRSKRKSRRVSSKTLVNLHNNEAGRKLIENNMMVECKCHGVSGSCELKTCWRAMPPFREVGEVLKDKFDGATQVRLKQIGGRVELEPDQQYFKKPTETDLVYTSPSPEYCDYDIKKGSLGTSGRYCNKTSRGLDGCDLLCCNRGYESQTERLVERCACKFQWCCYVQCSTCTKQVEMYRCK